MKAARAYPFLISPRETPDDGGGGLLAGLIAPLRLPERALEALEALVAAAAELGPMRAELARVREQTEPLAKLIPQLDRLHRQMKPLDGLLPGLERIREQTEPLAELIPALDRLHKQMKPLDGLLPGLERLDRQTKPLAELLPALERLEERLGTRLDSVHDVVVALEGDESHLNGSVRELQQELAEMHKTLSALQDDVQSVTDRLPDASRGPLEKARDVLTSGPATQRD